VNTNVIQAVMAETQAGKLVFPEVVRRLLEIGVESYFCDLAAGTETFYLRDGQIHAEKMTLPMAPIAEEFSRSGLLTAIRGAQADAIRYPDFAKRSAAAQQQASSLTGPSSPAVRSYTSAAKANRTPRSFPTPKSSHEPFRGTSGGGEFFRQ
jgi:hypothetical protein